MLTLTYSSTRQITSSFKTTVDSLYSSLHDTHTADNGTSVEGVAADYETLDDDSLAFNVSVNLQKQTTDADLVTDKDTLAQTVVDLGYEDNKADAKENIAIG